MCARISTIHTFKDKSIKSHGEDRYDYSRVNYIDSATKVEIGCNKCGAWFWQVPHDHQRGRGCPHCARKARKLTKEEFIRRSEKVHPGRYDYSRVVYTHANDKVEIGCNRGHGWFWQRAADHMNGRGCPACRTVRIRKGLEEFIRVSEEKHGKGTYDYSRVVYTALCDKVEIGCSRHGWFWQTAAAHISGHGCVHCSYDNAGWGGSGYYGTDQPSHLYFLSMQLEDDEWLKVGLAKDLDKRTSEMKRHLPGCEIDILAAWRGPANTLWKQGEVEVIHHSGIPRIIREDWSWAGRTECFDISYKDQLEEFLTTTLTPLQGVERIL